MKIDIEENASLRETEVLIRCQRKDEHIASFALSSCLISCAFPKEHSLGISKERGALCRTRAR